MKLQVYGDGDLLLGWRIVSIVGKPLLVLCIVLVLRLLSRTMFVEISSVSVVPRVTVLVASLILRIPVSLVLGEGFIVVVSLLRTV